MDFREQLASWIDNNVRDIRMVVSLLLPQPTFDNVYQRNIDWDMNKLLYTYMGCY